jgi:dihydroxyacetone kinase-like predicted kinase
MKELELKERQKYYNENKGQVRPGDADAIIEDRLAPKRQKIQDEMLRIMENAVAKTDGKFNIEVGQQIDEKPVPSSLPVGYKLEEDNGTIWINTGSKWVVKKGK